MKKFSGIDLHSNNSVIVISDETDSVLYQRRAYRGPVHTCALSCSSGLKLAAEQFALPDDGKQCTDFELRVIRRGNGGGASIGPALHYDMATAPTDLNKPVFTSDTADFTPRQDAQFTHAPLRRWSPVSGRVGGF